MSKRRIKLWNSGAGLRRVKEYFWGAAYEKYYFSETGVANDNTGINDPNQSFGCGYGCRRAGAEKDQ